MIKKIILGLIIIVVLFVGFVALQPGEFRISRSATIAAPPEHVFAQVNDFHNWEAWSPWAKLDPESKVTFDGPSAGTGSIFTWSGNDKVGEGRMTITDSQPHELIQIKLEFKRPFEDTCATEFKFAPDGEQTLVTWTMSGQNGFMGKLFCLFMNMDDMVGSDFEKGLASIKSVAEAAQK
jgi:uncharacterized protein YndB with AHSA1/START domain